MSWPSVRHRPLCEQGPSFGALWVAKTLCDRLGITASLGKNRYTPLVLLMIAARLLEPGSKLAAMRWAKTHAIKEIFGLEPESFDENSFYRALFLVGRETGRH